MAVKGTDATLIRRFERARQEIIEYLNSLDASTVSRAN